MAWFDDLRLALPEQYDPARPLNIVGYLRGSPDPAVWRQMEERRKRRQMLILGNREPTQQEWDAAGVGGRIGSHAITIDRLNGFIVLYGGFMYRPWGSIYPLSNDALTIGFPGSLRSWIANRPRRR